MKRRIVRERERDMEAGWIGPKGEISCSCSIGQSDRWLCGSNCLSYVHVNYRERESERGREREGERERVNKSAKENGTKEAQVFPLSKQVNGLTLHRPLIKALVSNPLCNTASLHVFIITHIDKYTVNIRLCYISVYSQEKRQIKQYVYMSIFQYPDSHTLLWLSAWSRLVPIEDVNLLVMNI